MYIREILQSYEILFKQECPCDEEERDQMQR